MEGESEKSRSEYTLNTIQRYSKHSFDGCNILWTVYLNHLATF